MISSRTLLVRKIRRRYVSLFAALAFGVLSVAATIPFVYESTTLWYKFGFDRLLLRSGQIIGLMTLVLLGLQMLLASRLGILDRIIGLDRVYGLHRRNGVVILLLACTHALLVLIPEGLDNLPIGWKYWPEMLSAFVLFLLCPQVIIALYRSALGLGYQQWRRLHRLTGFTFFPVLNIHALFVTTTFAEGLPRSLLLTFSGTILLVVFFHKAYVLGRRSAWRISSVRPMNDTVTALTLHPADQKDFSYAPGQFAFISPAGSLDVAKEFHPFTIASSPVQGKYLRFLIKHSGDWTQTIRRFEPGDVMRVEGPYGLFSWNPLETGDECIMIAGGIGITPMLSMLNALADARVPTAITLIWSNRRQEDFFCEEEIAALRQQMPQLTTHWVLTSLPQGEGRLNQERLAPLLASCHRTIPVYLCGPRAMMKSIRAILLDLGFASSRIYWERFSL